ncbi:MAG: hypothetical protein AB7P40_27625 [Chloroflexota bacterium]
MQRGCLAAIGIGMALFSAFFVVTAAVELATGTWGDTSPGVLAGILVLFGGMLLAGLFLTWQMVKGRPASPSAGRPGTPGPSGFPPPPTGAPWNPQPAARNSELLVLRFAESEHGRVTLPEVAANCDLSIADAKSTLESLVLQQAATINVTQSGVLVYVFPGFLSDDDKASATDF